MRVVINELYSVDEPEDSPGYIRVYVNATAIEGPRRRTEEFLIGRQVEGERVVTRQDGWWLSTDGSYYDPNSPDSDLPEPIWKRERSSQDFRAEIMQTLRVSFLNIFRNVHRESSKHILRKRLQPKLRSVSRLPERVRQLLGSTQEL